MEVFLPAMENVTMKRFLSFTKRDATNEEWKKMEERKGYFDCILVEEFVRCSLPFREYIYVIVFSNRFEKSVILKKLILKSLLGKIGYFYSLFFIREITF